MQEEVVKDPMQEVYDFIEECEAKIRDWVEVHGFKEEISPLGDQVIVRKFPDRSVSAGGIVLPGSSDEPVKQGQVIAVGPGRVIQGTKEILPMTLKVGQYVTYGQFSGNNTVRLNGEHFIIMREDEITGVYGRRPADQC